MAQYSDTNLIVNYLPQELRDEDLFRLFDSQAPGVKSVKICRNNATGYSYGYGFCDYSSHEAAARAIDTLNGHQLGRKTIKVAFARMRSEETRNCKLHISCLPIGITEDAMQQVLGRYGPIINCRLLHQQQQQQQPTGVAPRGLLGFCLFETHSSAQAALDALHNRPWPGSELNANDPHPMPVQIRFADENEKKVRPPLAGGRGGGFAGGGGGRPYYQNQNQNQQQQQQFYRPNARQRGGGGGGGGGYGQPTPAWYTASGNGTY